MISSNPRIYTSRKGPHDVTFHVLVSLVQQLLNKPTDKIEHDEETHKVEWHNRYLEWAVF